MSGGAKEECVYDICERGGGGMPGNFYLRECFFNDKTINFFQIFCNVAVGSQIHL